MESADLGYPILLSILIFWAIFAVSAVLTTFTKKENLKDVRKYIHHLLDTDSKHSQRG